MSAARKTSPVAEERGVSIRTRMTRALATTVGVTATGIVAMSALYGIQLVREDFDYTTQLAVRQFADNASYPTVTGSATLLEELVGRFRSHPDVHALRLYDGVEGVLADAAGRPYGQHPAGDELSSAEIAEALEDTVVSGRRLTLAIRAGRIHVEPIFSQPLGLPWERQGPPTVIGAIAVELDASRLVSTEWRIAAAALGMAVLIGVVLLPVIFGLSRRVTGPLADLANAVRSGELDPARFLPTPSDPAELVSLKNALRSAIAQSARRLEALENSERRSRAVFESSQDGMALVAPDGTLVALNPVLDDCFRGCDLPEGHASLGDAFRSAHSIQESVDRALASGSAEIEPCVLGSGPTSRTGQLRLSRLASNDEVLLLAVFLDRTEALAEERRRSLLEQRLRQGQKLEALGVMAGGIAHDFNNQLNIMLGNLILLRDDLPEDPGTAPLLDDLEGATRHCVELTRHLVTFARQDQPPGGPTGIVRLGDIARETLRLLRRTLPSTIEVQAEITDELPPVVADRTQVQQVLMNLCLNAADAMPDGGRLSVRVRIASAAEAHARPVREGDDDDGASDEPQQTLVLEVADSGHGMSPDVLERIFDPFFTTKAVGRGAGLGLSTSFGIVRTHGGWIDAESEPGRGSRFRVFWRASREAVQEEAGPTTPVPRGTERLLIAEDDARLRELTRAMLERQGYRVTVASDGEEALRMHRGGRPFDLLVLDLVMPATGGAEVLRVLRSGGDESPVVLTSGYDHGPELARLIADHGADFLPKPYTPYDLARKVRDMLDHRRRDEEPSRA